LAYCSAPYFKNLKDDKAVSPTFAARPFFDEPITKIQEPAKWNMNDKLFVRDVSWFSDGKFQADWGGGKVTMEKYRAPYDAGFVWGRFENLAWTNWSGNSLPSSFKIMVYHPSYPANAAPDLDVLYTITGTLEKIRNIGNFSPVPELQTKTLITDWRIKRKGQINSHGSKNYVSTNQWDSSDAIHQPHELKQLSSHKLNWLLNISTVTLIVGLIVKIAKRKRGN
jgi:hypothetical protein